MLRRSVREAWHGDFAEPHLNFDGLCHALALEIRSPNLTSHSIPTVGTMLLVLV